VRGRQQKTMAALNFTKKCRNELQTQTDQKTLLCVGATLMLLVFLEFW
jgi:hypothetical protein